MDRPPESDNSGPCVCNMCQHSSLLPPKEHVTGLQGKKAAWHFWNGTCNWNIMVIHFNESSIFKKFENNLNMHYSVCKDLYVYVLRAYTRSLLLSVSCLRYSAFYLHWFFCFCFFQARGVWTHSINSTRSKKKCTHIKSDTQNVHRVYTSPPKKKDLDPDPQWR